MTQPTMRAGDFINSLGVGAHLESPSVGSQPYLVAAEMSYLGITNMRVEAPFANLSAYTILGQAGIKFDAITASTDIPSQLGFFNSIAPYLSSIEGINEINGSLFSYDNMTGPAAAEQFQADLYTAIKADPLLANIPVLSFSLSVGASETGYGSDAAYADYGNLHAYTSGGGSPNQSIAYQQNLVSLTPGKSNYLTETGYYTDNDGGSGVSNAVQAIYTVDSLLDGAADGMVKTYIYELIDDVGDADGDSEGHYGLFTSGAQAKPAADAIHNLTTLLTDTGAGASTFTPSAQTVTVTGLGAVNGFSQVFAKSSGEIDVAVWAEPNLYNTTTGVEWMFSSPVTLNFGGSYNVLVYDPIAGLTPIGSATNVSSYTVNLGDDALVVELTPVKSTAGVAIPPVANPDSAATTATSSGVWISATNNDTGLKGYTLSVTSVNTTGTMGKVTLNPAAANGIWYSPGSAFAYLSQGQTATDSFTYTISDGHGGTATATDTVTITGVTSPPVANADSAVTTATSSGVWVGAANNDTDAKGYTLSVASVNTAATKGTVTLIPSATNGVWYSPGKAFAYLSQGETATDSFVYTVSDGHGGAASATDTITITGVNQAPVAKNDAVATTASKAVAVGLLASATDVNRDDTLSVTGLNTTGIKGSVALGAGGVATYTPGAAFQHLAAGTTATDSFGYTVSDNHGATSSATANVTITGTWTAPVTATAFVSLAANTTIAATAGSGPTMQFLTAATGTLALSEAAAPANSASSLIATILNTSASPSSGWAVEIDTTATLKAMTGGLLTNPSTNVYLFTPATNNAQIGAGGTASFSLEANAGSTAAAITGKLLAHPTT